MSITQTIDSLPSAPSRSEPSTFASLADAFVDGMVSFQAQCNTWATQANDLGQTCSAAAVNCQTTETSVIALVSATVYSALTTYTFPDAVISSNGHTYRCISSTGVIGDNPATSTAGNWRAISTRASPTVTVTASSPVVAEDGTVYGLDTTSGAITLTLPGSPIEGVTRVGVFDPEGTWDTNAVTLNRNGNQIMGLASNCICDLPYDGFDLLFVGAGNGGWRFFT